MRLNSWRRFVLRCVGMYLRRAPMHPGRWRLIEPAVMMAPLLRTMSGSRVIRAREGFRLRVDGSSQTGRMLYMTGEYEQATTRVIQKILAPGQTMIDVGANIGYFSILGARTVGPHGRITAFEPMGRVRQQLVENLRLNGLANVTVREEALARASGEASFYPGPENDTGLASLRPLERSAEVRVKQARLDDLWDHQHSIALIKMDVEGAEMSALEGMEQCLRRHEPDLIVEITDEYLRGLGSSAASLYAFLDGKGYAAYEIGTEGRLFPVTSAGQLERCPSQFNALFTKRANAALQIEARVHRQAG
jgi:FkbM family methyltransferase